MNTVSRIRTTPVNMYLRIDSTKKICDKPHDRSQTSGADKHSVAVNRCQSAQNTHGKGQLEIVIEVLINLKELAFGVPSP